jgi:hypothetical protein
MKVSFTRAEKTKRAEKQTLAALVHPSAWKTNSANFACLAYSEVRRAVDSLGLRRNRQKYEHSQNQHH